jgi:phage regulator Rha-like protein
VSDNRLWLDSRDLAERFGQRHHNMLASLDRIVARCPDAAGHVRVGTYSVNAGMGGRRHVRHALLDRVAFTMLATTISPMRCEAVFQTLIEFERAAPMMDGNPKFGMA